MKISPIKDIEVAYFKNGVKGGFILLERGYEEEVTILRKSNGMLDIVLEEEPDRIQCRVPLDSIQVY